MKKWIYLGVLLLGILLPSSVKADHYGIVIDGNFSDWATQPKTKLSFAYNNNNVNKQIAVLRDDQYLYLYLDMDPDGKGHNYRFQGSGWTLSSGRNSTTLSINTNKQPSVGQMATVTSVWAWSNGTDPDGLFMNQQITGATGVVVTQQVRGNFRDQAEIRIPLAGFIKQPNLVKELTIRNSNLGEQAVTVSGGSTGPFLIASAGFIFVLGLVYIQSRKGKKVC